MFSSSLINSNFNANKTKINEKYKHCVNELLGYDYSNIVEVISGFLDDSSWGLTKYNNIVCLEKGKHFRRIIHFIDKPLYEQNSSSYHHSSPYSKTANVKEDIDDTYYIHTKYKHNIKKASGSEYNIHKNKRCNRKSDHLNKHKYYKKRNTKDNNYNYHSYFHNKPDFSDDIVRHLIDDGSGVPCIRCYLDSSHDPYNCYFCNQYNLFEDEIRAEYDDDSGYDSGYDSDSESVFDAYWNY